MPRNVAIVAVAQTPYRSRHTEWSLEELIFRTVRSVPEKVGLGIEDVESMVISSSDQVDGRAISIMVTSGPVGAYGKDLLNAPSSGEHALAMAYLRVASGMFDTSLVVGWNKCSEPRDLSNVQNLTADYTYHRDLGLNDTISQAFQAGAYLDQYSVPEEAAARVVVKNRANGARNPLAHLRETIALDAAVEAPYVSWPLRQMHLPPQSDGVCALLIAAEDKALELVPDGPAWINGLAWATETYWMGDRSLASMKALETAARQAYAMAGISRPADELDVMEIHDVTAYHELMAYEALGLCSPGEAHRLVLDGRTEFDGKMPVNPSGGALSANPYFATGLVRAAEVALQVMGQAGDRQVPGARTGLAAAHSGFACQSSSVFIMSASRPSENER
jgi:acetyl-CoA C-acetyltransferase